MARPGRREMDLGKRQGWIGGSKVGVDRDFYGGRFSFSHLFFFL